MHGGNHTFVAKRTRGGSTKNDAETSSKKEGAGKQGGSNRRRIRRAAVE